MRYLLCSDYIIYVESSKVYLITTIASFSSSHSLVMNWHCHHSNCGTTWHTWCAPPNHIPKRYHCLPPSRSYQMCFNPSPHGCGPHNIQALVYKTNMHCILSFCQSVIRFLPHISPTSTGFGSIWYPFHCTSQRSARDDDKLSCAHCLSSHSSAQSALSIALCRVSVRRCQLSVVSYWWTELILSSRFWWLIIVKRTLFAMSFSHSWRQTHLAYVTNQLRVFRTGVENGWKMRVRSVYE